MSFALLTGLLAGMGCLGVVRGLAPAHPSLEAIAAALESPPPAPGGATTGRAFSLRSSGEAMVGVIESKGITRERWRSLGPDFAITGETPGSVASKMLVLGGTGLLMPPLLWLIGEVAGSATVPLGMTLLASLVACPAGVALPYVVLARHARDRRRHARAVVSSFVDLVVLNLAGGMGIESALLGAAQVSGDWSAKWISRALLRAHESGTSSWAALSQLGEEIGVPELVELSATLQLAGTEGSWVRQSLSARAVALRRHEQADAESAANTTTERLFLPGALLLVGFLLFVGYPAFSRIVGGF